MRRLSFLFFLLLFGVSWAALPPRSSEQLDQASSDVVVGTVVEVRTRTEKVKHGSDRVSVALLRVESVDKGKLRPGVLVEAHFRQTGQRSRGWAGPQGQNEPLTKGLRARVYLVKEAGVYRLLEPNGWAEP